MVYFSRFFLSLSSFLILWGGPVALSNLNIAAHAATLETTANEDALTPAVAAFQTISTLRKQDPVDADAITAAYTSVLQSLAQQVDTASSLNLDSDVLAAIEDIRNNNEAFLAVQVIDKTLQRVFFESILARITAVRDDFESKTTEELLAEWNEAALAFEAITGTAGRENKVLTSDRQSIETGSNPGLDVQITESFARGRLALNKENPTEDIISIGIERQIIRLSLVRAYYIGVLREVDGIISNRDRELGEAREKQKEGEVFYRLVEDFVARDNSVGNVLINKQLTENVFNVVADEIVSELSKGFIGRVKGELNASESSVGSDRGRAMVVAEEALLYSNVFQPDLTLRLGASISNDLDAALNDLKSASNAGDTSKASDARERVTTILDNYEDALVLAEYEKASDIHFVDSAVAAFQTIGALRKQNPVDADAIAAEYDGDLQQLTKLIDQLFALTTDNDILTAIADIKNNNRIDLAVQIIDKTLQRVMALVIYNRITLIHDEFANLSTDIMTLELDRAYEAYLSIIGTVARDNKVLTVDRSTLETGSNPNLDGEVTAAFIRAKQTLSRENVTDQTNFAVEREVIALSLARSFFIGVLREVEGIIGNRDREIAKAEEKQIEGEFFYRIVEGFVTADNPVGSNRIKSQLTGNLANVVADNVVSEISRGLLGRLNRHLNINAQTVENEQNQAKIAAEQVSLYAGIFLPDLELRLDSFKRVSVENALQDLKEASNVSNVSKADNARQVLTAILMEYSNTLN